MASYGIPFSFQRYNTAANAAGSPGSPGQAAESAAASAPASAFSRDEGFQFFEISDLELHLGRCCGCAVPSHEERAADAAAAFSACKLRIDRLRSRDLKRG